MTDDAVPPGYTLDARNGAFWRLSGPYYHRPADVGVAQAFRVRDDHCNARGFLHGAMLSAFVDGLFAAAARGDGPTALTVHLSLDFLAMGQVGDWVEGEARVTQAGREVIFVEGRVHVAGRDIARASGVFRAPRPETR